MFLLRRVISAVLFSSLGGCGGAAPAPVAVAAAPVALEEPKPPVDKDDGADDAPKIQTASVDKDGKSKNAQCNALIGVINDAVDELTKASSSGATNSTGTADYVNMADTMDRAGTNISKVATSDKRLKELSGQYQTMARQVVKSARALVVAAEARDMAKVNVAKASVEKAVKQEDPIVDAINKYCREP